MAIPIKKRLSPTEYSEGILSGNKIVLSQAITIIESNLESDQFLAEEILENILPHTGKAKRIGITGMPGVGKSTFIETFGIYLVEMGMKPAVLAIDPSSRRSGGSILGDKTRMEKLSKNPNAFIRPSSSRNTLGGIAEKTRETLLLCEAAGYDVIIVETVGVGQSEVAVRDMVDFFLLLMLAGAGDELQGIKKGIVELADAIVITKADGKNTEASSRARKQFQNALHLLSPTDSGWKPEVKTCSSIENKGIDEIWNMMVMYEAITFESGFWDQQRSDQNISWMHYRIDNHFRNLIFSDPEVRAQSEKLEKDVKSGKITPTKAARILISMMKA